jgi:hypothetical protein
VAGQQPVVFSISNREVTIPVEDARLLVRSLGLHGGDGDLYCYETTAGRVYEALLSGDAVRLETRRDMLALLRVLDHLRNQRDERLRDATAAWRLRGLIIDVMDVRPVAYTLAAKGGVMPPQRFVSHSGHYVARDFLVTPAGKEWRVVTVEGDADSPQTLICHSEP